MAKWVFDPTVFEPTYYADQNKGVRDKIGYDTKKLMEHWGNFGIKEGRPSHPDFEVKEYLRLNQDVAREYGRNNYIKAINHCLQTGYKEGRITK